MTRTERDRERITQRIEQAARSGDTDALNVAADELFELGRKDGADSLAIDLHDAGEITPDGIEFMIENNGVSDPRR